MCDCRTLLVFLNWHPAEGEKGCCWGIGAKQKQLFFRLECIYECCRSIFLCYVGYCSAREWLGTNVML